MVQGGITEYFSGPSARKFFPGKAKGVTDRSPQDQAGNPIGRNWSHLGLWFTIISPVSPQLLIVFIHAYYYLNLIVGAQIVVGVLMT
jgi:hypothetical protein